MMNGSRYTGGRGHVHAGHHMSIMLAVCLGASLANVTPALAQTPPRRETPIFLLGFEGHYGAPQRTGAGVELFLPMQKWHCDDGLCGGHGVEVQASTAMGGWRFGGGPVLMAYPLWFDLLVTLTRTSATPRGADPESSYVGVEGGFSFPVYANRKRYINLRPSLGVARRVNGVAGPEQTTLIWSVGVHYVWPKF